MLWWCKRRKFIWICPIKLSISVKYFCLILSRWKLESILKTRFNMLKFHYQLYSDSCTSYLSFTALKRSQSWNRWLISLPDCMARSEFDDWPPEMLNVFYRETPKTAWKAVSQQSDWATLSNLQPQPTWGHKGRNLDNLHQRRMRNYLKVRISFCFCNFSTATTLKAAPDWNRSTATTGLV